MAAGPLLYLDNHATTPVDPRVLETMLPFFRERFGNASSRSHAYGWEAERAVEQAREQVARLLGAEPREVLFTSGATEANNLALKGAAQALRGRGNRLVSAATEHPSVLESLAFLAGEGFQATVLPVDGAGRLAAAAVREALRPDTLLCSFMAANNEVGTLHPIAEFAQICRERGALLHCDATQAVGKVPFDVRATGVDLLSITGHKMYGPKGCGALFVRRGVALVRQSHGGGQERGLRAGTLNVPGIVGLGKAAEIALAEREEEARRVAALRDRLQGRLAAALPGLRVNGDVERRLPGNLHVTVPGVASDALMLAMPDVALSAGAACASGSVEPSHVMKALGLSPEAARCSVRFGIGRFQTEQEIDLAASRFLEAARRVRR